MRLYKRTDGSIAGTQADAGKGFTQIEVPTDKPGLIAYLNAMEARPCNQAYLAEQASSPPPAVTPPVEERPCPVRTSIQMDEDFDNLPLAHQLSLAARAMENARANIRGTGQ